MKEFIIDRSKWHRGGRTDLGLILLLNKQGNMCCLGFLGEQVCELKPDQLLGVCRPDSSSELLARYRAHVPDLTDDVIQDLVLLNDRNRNMSDDRREALLTEAFAQIGLKPVFVDSVKDG